MPQAQQGDRGNASIRPRLSWFPPQSEYDSPTLKGKAKEGGAGENCGMGPGGLVWWGARQI